MGMPGDPVHRRALSTDANRDDSSDYGLDFTSEEEELLSDILSGIPSYPEILITPQASSPLSSPESFSSSQSPLSLLDEDELVSILQASEALAEQLSVSTGNTSSNVTCGDSAFSPAFLFIRFFSPIWFRPLKLTL